MQRAWTPGRLLSTAACWFPFHIFFLFYFLFLSLFFPFLFITSFFWFSCLFFNFSFISFIFCVFRLLLPVKTTACATKSAFNQVFKEILLKMIPTKTLCVKYSIPKIKRYLLKHESEKKKTPKIKNLLQFYKGNQFKIWSEQQTSVVF